MVKEMKAQSDDYFLFFAIGRTVAGIFSKSYRKIADLRGI